MAKMEKHDDFIRVKIGGKDEFNFISKLLTPEQNAQREAWLNSENQRRAEAAKAEEAKGEKGAEEAERTEDDSASG